MKCSGSGSIHSEGGRPIHKQSYNTQYAKLWKKTNYLFPSNVNHSSVHSSCWTISVKKRDELHEELITSRGTSYPHGITPPLSTFILQAQCWY